MTRRRLLCGLLLLSAVLACFAGWLWIASAHPVSSARFAQVKKGMTREEVHRIVGGPPGDYSSGGRVGLAMAPSLFPDRDYYCWLCDDRELLVWFDETETVADVVVAGVLHFGTPTLTERIRLWLGL
jgi:hypothetical protein